MPRNLAKNGILRPLAASGFDAVQNDNHQREYPEPHPEGPEQQNKSKDDQRRRETVILRQKDLRKDQPEPQHHKNHDEDDVHSLQKQRLECVERDEPRLRLRDKDNQRSDPGFLLTFLLYNIKCFS